MGLARTLLGKVTTKAESELPMPFVPFSFLRKRIGSLPGAVLAAALAMALASASGAPVLAQGGPAVAGDYSGMLGPLHIKLHIHAGAHGALSGTLDSPDQGASGIACADFHLEGRNFSFRVPAIEGRWKGTVSDDGSALTGIWNQGTPMTLNFTRDTLAAAAVPPAVDGVWLGTPGAARLAESGLRERFRFTAGAPLPRGECPEDRA